LNTFVDFGIAHLHDGTLAKLFFDLLQRSGERFCLIVVHGLTSKYGGHYVTGPRDGTKIAANRLTGVTKTVSQFIRKCQWQLRHVTGIFQRVYAFHDFHLTTLNTGQIYSNFEFPDVSSISLAVIFFAAAWSSHATGGKRSGILALVGQPGRRCAHLRPTSTR
jgi:hypothetical protein